MTDHPNEINRELDCAVAATHAADSTCDRKLDSRVETSYDGDRHRHDRPV